MKGKDFSEIIHRKERHAVGEACPHCGEDVMGVGLTSLVYTFETCDCTKANFTHLVETLWHKECFAASLSEEKTEAPK